VVLLPYPPLPFAALCKGIAPFRGGGSAAARQRAPLARMHSELQQPCTAAHHAMPVSGQSSVVHVSLWRCENLRAPNRTPHPSRCALPAVHCGSLSPSLEGDALQLLPWHVRLVPQIARNRNQVVGGVAGMVMNLRLDLKFLFLELGQNYRAFSVLYRIVTRGTAEGEVPSSPQHQTIAALAPSLPTPGTPGALVGHGGYTAWAERRTEASLLNV
jgi:hypothetical protein